MASHHWGSRWNPKTPEPVGHWCRNQVFVSTESVKNHQVHAWQPGQILGHSPGDLPDGHLGGEIPGHVLGDLPDRRPDTTPPNDPTAVLEHVHCNVSKGISNGKS